MDGTEGAVARGRQLPAGQAARSALGGRHSRRTLAVAGSRRRPDPLSRQRPRHRPSPGRRTTGVTTRAMLAAFEGWNDAADAATGAIEHLEQEWGAQPFGAIDPEDYYDYQVNRPTVRLDDGVTRRIEWPTTRISVADAGDREVVLIRGLEPNMRWRAFCEELVEVAEELDVDTVVCLAALLADVPHTRPVDVHGSASEESTAAALGFTRSRYEGPTGIASVFHEACGRAGL